MAQTKNESMDAFQTTEWRGRKVTVRPEKVRLFMLSIQDLSKSVEKTPKYQAKIEMLENVLLDCKDAISAVKDDIKQDPKLRNVAPDQAVSGIQYLLAYLSYLRLTLTLERNLYLVAQTKQNLEETGEKQADGKKVLLELFILVNQLIIFFVQLLGETSRHFTSLRDHTSKRDGTSANSRNGER